MTLLICHCLLFDLHVTYNKRLNKIHPYWQLSYCNTTVLLYNVLQPNSVIIFCKHVASKYVNTCVAFDMKGVQYVMATHL